MKLRNTTDFDTATLRSLIRSVVREVEKTMVKHHPYRSVGLVSHWTEAHVRNRAKHILSETSIWVRQRRNNTTHGTGHANYSARRMILTLGNPEMLRFLWLARHEVWHLFGVKHKDFPATVMHFSAAGFTTIAEIYADEIARFGMILPLTIQSPKEKLDPETRAAQRLTSLEEKTKRWTTKLKRAQTALNKLKKSRTYYEKQIAIAASRKKM